MTQARARYAPLIIPFAIVLIVLVVWTAWWFWLSQQVRDRLDVAAEGLRAQGWEVVYSEPVLTGWPFRTRLESQHVRLTAPTGHEIAAPRLAAEANAYRPDRWVVVADDGLVLTRGDKGKVAVAAPVIRASASGLTEPFPNLALEILEPVFTAHPGAEPFPLERAERIELYLRPGEAREAEGATVQTALPASQRNVDVLFRLIDAVGRDGGPIAFMSRDGLFSLQAETVVENFQGLSGPDASSLLAAWTASGGRFLDVRGEMQAGESAARLTADELRADENGRLVGTLRLSADRAAPALAGLAQSDTVNRTATVGAAAAAGADEVLTGDVELEVEFREGRAWLGPFNLAPAPELF
ncbi:MAG: hypothetical protein ACI8U3_001533 [Brevundimonas sp.]|jgi:hypothetical protein|uniref:DUF2125 domain-containing protein n=1 Tax=Brevundimonas sp. TaxID=1871086 RepID=UPI0039E4B361